VSDSQTKLTQDEQPVLIEPMPLREVADALRRTKPFADANFDDFAVVPYVDRIVVKAGATVIEPGDPLRCYWVVLEGEIRADRPEKDGLPTPIGLSLAGEGYGEALMLSGKSQSPFLVIATKDSVLLRFSEDSFWEVLARSTAVRKVVLADMAYRLKSYQVEALHREKLISLGTMAAGLMHELNNPGSAAKRYATQLRGNLMRLQELSLRHAANPKNAEQLSCMQDLLEHAVRSCHAPAMSSLDQSDAEEAMSEWLQSAGVANAYTIGPALVAIGFDQHELDCARSAFPVEGFSDALNWLEALISSVSLVCAIEESIARVSELVMAVKKFAYDDRAAARVLDVHDSLQSTLTILGHKLRLKQISVEKRFNASPSTIYTRGSGISQVWTNLIDNAMDASPDNSRIEITTQSEPNTLVVTITDHGSGIPADVKPHIFEAFFTTKPQGEGTGLGLEIVHRIVTQKFGGTIDVESEPGNTRFTVRLPLSGASGTDKAAASGNSHH
jgi:signal transduction histidine kinase